MARKTVLAAALLVLTCSLLQAEQLILQEGMTIDSTPVEVDDLWLQWSHSTSLAYGTSYWQGTDDSKASTYMRSGLIGFKQLFDFLPVSDGLGGTLQINSAALQLLSYTTPPSDFTIGAYRQTSMWMLMTPGASESNANGAYSDATNSQPWSAGDYSASDFTTVNGDTVIWAHGDIFFDVTDTLKDIYTSNDNQGWAIVFASGDLSTVTSYNTQLPRWYASEAWTLYQAQGSLTSGETLTGEVGPKLIIDYEYTSGATSTPEPATMLLVGSGLIGLAGAIRRKHMN